MPIDPDIKKKLDEQMVLGNITEEEYERKLNLLEKSSRISAESRPYEYKNQTDSLEDAPTIQQNGADLSNAPTILQDNNEIDDLSNAPTIISSDGLESYVDDSDVERNTEEFINRYKFQSNIGAGGMGEVSLYKDTKLNRLVAVKRLRNETTGFSEQANRRFKAEAQTIAGLNHQNIVSVYDIGEDNQGLFIIMEYIDGTDLSKYIKVKNKIPVEEALKLIRQVAQALNYAHRRKIFHRDIKPANILLTEEDIPKIVDFGLAKAGGDTSYSMTGFGMGTMAYASPEQKRDAKNVDHRADIYALGATLYELVTASNPSVIKSDEIPFQLKSLILKCVEEKPENRYFSIDEMLSQIDKITGAGIKIQKKKKNFGEVGICPQCQYQNPTDVKFCQNCGTGLTDKCPKCQFENTIWSKRCGSCGVVIDDYKKYLDHIAKGGEYFKQKKYSRAIKEYKFALEIYSDNQDIKNKLQESEQKYEEVKELREKAVQLFRTKVLNYALLTVNELISKEAPSEETNNLKKQIKENISITSYLVKSAETEKKKGNYENGLKFLEEAKNLDKSNEQIDTLKETIENCIETQKNFEKLYSKQKYDEAFPLIYILNKEVSDNETIQKKYEEVNELENKLTEYEKNINQAIYNKNLKSAKAELQKALKISPNIKSINELDTKLKILIEKTLDLFEKSLNEFNNKNIKEALKYCEEAKKICNCNEKNNNLNKVINSRIEEIEQLIQESKIAQQENYYEKALFIIEKAISKDKSNEIIISEKLKLQNIIKEIENYCNKITYLINEKNIFEAKKLSENALVKYSKHKKLNELNNEIISVENKVSKIIKQVKNLKIEYKFEEALDKIEEGQKLDSNNEILKVDHKATKIIISNLNDLNTQLNKYKRDNDYFEIIVTLLKIKKIKPISENILLECSKELEKIWNKRYLKIFLEPNEKKQLNYLNDRKCIIENIMEFSEIIQYLSFLKSGLESIIEILNNMILVQAGTFMMGSPTNERGRLDNESQHEVTLTRDYYIGKYMVTQEQWEAVMNSNPSRFKGVNMPVENVSWNGVQKFIKKLNHITGKNFRLPPEAEWEYAARGGNKSKGHIYSGSNNIDEVACYDSNSNNQTQMVGQKNANELGIYDMSGNLWEWCSDWYADYLSENVTNLTGGINGSSRVFRGGS